MRKIATAALLMTAACAAAPAPEPVPVHGSGRTCNDRGLQDMVGRPANSQLAAEAQRRSGAGTVRWLQPGQMVTMEFREDRLNISVENGRAVRLRCG